MSEMDKKISDAFATPTTTPTPEHVEGDVLNVGEMEALARRLRDYRPPALDPAHGREHHPICDEADDALTSATSRIQKLERDLRSARLDTLAAYGQNDEMSAQLAKAGRERDSWRRVAERLEGEKQAAEAQLADAVKVLEPFAAMAAEFEEWRKGSGKFEGSFNAADFAAARDFITSLREKPDAE